MNSRERLIKALNHEEADRPPLVLGTTAVTGIHASTLYKLRAALGLESRPVTVHEPFQMLGRVDDDVRAALGVDVVGLDGPGTFFGYRNENWKPWQLNDGTPVLMGGGFEYDRNPDGAVFAYPQGDRSCKPSVKMPAGGWFFDAIDRTGPMNEDDLDDMADCGVDITNPVQCSATGMEPAVLKQRFGDRLVFWGGVSDTQKTLPFGTPEEVRHETAERIRIFAKGGGFVFNTIHNVQANTPVENLLALYESLKG